MIYVGPAWGYDGLRSGDFVVYRYDGEIGYQTVSVWHNPIAEVINDSRPARVQVRDYVGWDGFPMIDLDNPSMVELELHARQFDITYVWNSDSSNFMEVDKTEIFARLQKPNISQDTVDRILERRSHDERVHFLYPVFGRIDPEGILADNCRRSLCRPDGYTPEVLKPRSCCSIKIGNGDIPSRRYIESPPYLS